jgi:hypothetical protein
MHNEPAENGPMGKPYTHQSLTCGIALREAVSHINPNHDMLAELGKPAIMPTPRQD